jgi:hypothetical protein
MIAAKQAKTAADLPWSTAAWGSKAKGKVTAPAVSAKEASKQGWNEQAQGQSAGVQANDVEVPTHSGKQGARVEAQLVGGWLHSATMRTRAQRGSTPQTSRPMREQSEPPRISEHDCCGTPACSLLHGGVFQNVQDRRVDGVRLGHLDHVIGIRDRPDHAAR